MAATARTVNRNRTVGTGSRTRMANAGNGYYVQGNAVRRLDVTQEIVREPQKKISNTAIKPTPPTAKSVYAEERLSSAFASLL